MNKYTSKTMRTTARNVYSSQALVPPAALNIPVLSWTPQLVSPFLGENGASANSGIVIHNVGVFSNLADGLILNDELQGLTVLVEALAFNTDGPNLTGLVSYTTTSNVITGVGCSFNTELVEGDVIKFNNASLYGSVSATPLLPDTLTVSRNMATVATNVQAKKLISAGTAMNVIEDITTLNDMYPFEWYINPYEVSSGTSFDLMLLRARVFQKHTTKFKTDLISPDAVDWTLFHIVLDVEYTVAP